MTMIKNTILQLSRLKYFLTLCLVGGCIGLVAMTVFVYVPLIEEIGQQKEMLQEITVKIANAKILNERLPKAEEKLQQAQERYRHIQRLIGKKASMARVLETLNVSAQEHHLELVAIQPRTNGEQPVIQFGSNLIARQIPIHLQLTGRFRSIAEFLGTLPDAPFLAFLNELTMRKTQGGGNEIESEMSLIVLLGETG